MYYSLITIANIIISIKFTQWTKDAVVFTILSVDYSFYNLSYINSFILVLSCSLWYKKERFSIISIRCRKKILFSLIIAGFVSKKNSTNEALVHSRERGYLPEYWVIHLLYNYLKYLSVYYIRCYEYITCIICPYNVCDVCVCWVITWFQVPLFIWYT